MSTDKRILTANKDSQTIGHFHDDGSLTIEKKTDYTKKFEDNKAIRNMVTSLDRWGDGKMVLSGCPPELIQEWKQKGWFTKESFYKCLADPRAQPYKVFR